MKSQGGTRVLIALLVLAGIVAFLVFFVFAGNGDSESPTPAPAQPDPDNSAVDGLGLFPGWPVSAEASTTDLVVDRVTITDPDQIAAEVVAIEAELAGLAETGRNALELDCEAFIAAVEAVGPEASGLAERLYRLPDSALDQIMASQAVSDLEAIGDQVSAKADDCGYSPDDNVEPSSASDPGSPE